MAVISPTGRTAAPKASGSSEGSDDGSVDETNPSDDSTGPEDGDRYDASAEEPAPVDLRGEGKDRDADDAVAETSEALKVNPQSEDDEPPRIVEDPPDVTSEEPMQVRQEALENAPLEREAYDKLPPSQRRQYDQLTALLAEEEDWAGRASLQKLLLSGQLQDRDALGDSDLLEHLSLAADPIAPLAKGVDRGALAGALVRELATPAAIAQGKRGTCAPTASLIDLARTDPAEYARLTRGLALGDGRVQLQGDAALQREPGTAAPDGSDRSVTQRLLGSAAMEIANGDKAYRDDAAVRGGGASFEGLRKLDAALKGGHVTGVKMHSDVERPWGMNLLDQHLEKGESVLANIVWAKPAESDTPGKRDLPNHEVLVTRTGEADGKPYVEFINPQGKVERLGREDFQDRLTWLHYVEDP